MKFVILSTNKKLKLTFLVFLLMSLEVFTFNEKSVYETDLIQRMRTKPINTYEKTKAEINVISNEIRFKSETMGDSEENNEILNNSIVIEEGELEIFAKSANARSEFKWGFAFWSFMNFGASNALSRHSGYWLSERNSKNDYWDAKFNTPHKIDVIEIHWRLPPKKMKILYKLNPDNDWIPATETYSRDSLKDINGNKIPSSAISNYNSIYFKKPLICTAIRITMSQPMKKNSFSIEKVLFFKKINRGLLHTSTGSKKYCWYINSDLPREGVPIYAYPCIRTIMFASGNELFKLTTNRMIKLMRTNYCAGYDESTKTIMLKICDNDESAYRIQYNYDSSMYFDKQIKTAIYMDKKVDVINFITPETDIVVSSEADQNQFKKENILLASGSYWASVPGQQDVTIQLIFGKVKCVECKDKGKYEKKIIDIITINWEREASNFTVYIWNPGYSWKTVGNFKNNKSKSTNISLIAETATGIMIRMTDGPKYPELGNQVSYGIKSIIAGFNGYKLKFGKYENKDISTRLFEFEAQAITSKTNTKDFDNAFKKIGENFEKSINTFKLVKTNLPSIDKVKRQGGEMCKKLNSFSKIVGEDNIAKLNNFKQTTLKSFDNSDFKEVLVKFGEISSMASVTGKPSSSISSNSAGVNMNLVPNKNKNGNDENEEEEDETPSSPSKTFSSGISSKNKEPDNDVDRPQIGTKEAPGENCLHLRKLDPVILSGFYYIKPECSPKPIRVFCDFTLFGEAVDIYIFKDGSHLPNPDLSYLNISNANDVKAQCGKYGLSPIELQNRDMVNRVLQLLLASGMDLSRNNYVPLGYDFSCKNNKCSYIYNSINTANSLPIMNFFNKARYPGQSTKNVGRFAGLGKLNESSMITFDASNVKITGLICSSNKFSGDYSDNPSTHLTCKTNVSNNQDTFSEGKDVIAICPKACQTNDAPIYGAGLYHGDSSICKAAIHQGVIGGDGGKVIVRVQSNSENYNGSLLNGIKSNNHLNDGMIGFVVLKFRSNCPYKNAMYTSSSFLEQKDFIELKELNESLYVDKESNINNTANTLINGLLNNQEVNNPMENKNINLQNYQNFQEKFTVSQFQNTNTNSINSILNQNSNSPTSSLNEIIPNNISTSSDILNLLNNSSNKRIENQSATSKDMKAQSNLSTELGELPKYEPIESINKNSVLNSTNNLDLNESNPVLKNLNNIPIENENQVKSVESSLLQTINGSEDNSILKILSNTDNSLPKFYQISNDLSGQESLKADNNLGGIESTFPISPKQKLQKKKGHGKLTNAKNVKSPNTLDKGKSPETTSSAQKKLKQLYNASFGSYLQNLKIKAKKIADTFTNFGSGLNQAISSGIQFSDASSTRSKDGSMNSQSCSVLNIQKIYKKMAEFKGKVSGLIDKMQRRAKSRILKTEKIKEKFRDRLSSYNLQKPVIIDLNVYPSIDVARKEVFSNIFMIQKQKSVSSKANWDITSKNIKGRKRAIGVTISEVKTGSISSSTIQIRDKEYYDFKLSVDLLFLSKGVAGIAFRVQNKFNYYCFIIDKNSGYKAIGKMINGNLKILKKIDDGGILLNEWHSVIITVSASLIRVYMYDKETASKAISEKTIEVEDSSFVRGTASIFINGMNGFYFDNFSIEPLKCWTPWQPKENMKIKNTNTNIYYEDFRGSFEEKYKVVDIEEQIAREGPANWNITYEDGILGSFISQTTNVFDSSPKKRPSFALLKHKNFCNGVYKVHFQPEHQKGMISIIFKYKKDVNSTGNAKEEFYSFDLMNQNEPSFKFRKWNNGEIKILNSLNVSQIPGLKKAYIASRPNIVEIEYVGNRVTIRMSQDRSKFYDIMNIVEDSIKCGSVGFGTSNTDAKFTGVNLQTLKLKLTPLDIDLIINKTLDRLPIPSVREIRSAAESNPSISSKLIKNSSALGYILSEISILGSSLGFNLKVDKASGGNSGLSVKGGNNISNNSINSTSTKKIDANDKNSNIFGNEWRVCVVSTNFENRKKYCQVRHNNAELRKKCEQNFCTECCEKNINSIFKNVIHICKKTCYKSTLTVDNSNEYKNVCISSSDTKRNIYDYCEQKMNRISQKSKESCKLDMCNLCCVTMDAMKSKSYSINNLTKCYNDCNKDKDGNNKNKQTEEKDLFANEDVYDMKKIKLEVGLPLYPVIKHKKIYKPPISNPSTSENPNKFENTKNPSMTIL